MVARRPQVEVVLIGGAADVDTLPPNSILLQSQFLAVGLKVTLRMLLQNRAENRS